MRRQELIEKISARTFARVYTEPLVPSVFEELYNGGYFNDVVEHGEWMVALLLDWSANATFL